MFFLNESHRTSSDEQLTLSESYLALAEAYSNLSEANTALLVEDFNCALSEGNTGDKLKVLFMKWMHSAKMLLNKIIVAIKSLVQRMIAMLTGKKVFVLVEAITAFETFAEEALRHTSPSDVFEGINHSPESAEAKVKEVTADVKAADEKFANTMKSLNKDGEINDDPKFVSSIKEFSDFSEKLISDVVKEISSSNPTNDDEFKVQRILVGFYSGPLSSTVMRAVRTLQGSLVMRKESK